MPQNLGGVLHVHVWVGGVVKVIGRSGLVKLHDSYFAYSIFDKIYACNLVCGLQLAFPYLFLNQNSVKIACFHVF